MSSGAVALAPLAVIALAPVALAGLAVGGLAYAAVAGARAIAEEHQRQLEARERRALQHELSRLRVEATRRTELVAHAGRLRVEAPSALGVTPTTSVAARSVADAVVVENDRWVARLEAEQAELNRQTRDLVAATARRDLLLVWVEQDGRPGLAERDLPAFSDRSAVEEAKQQIVACLETNRSLTATLQASRRGEDKARADRLWEAIRMTDVDDAMLMEEQPWRRRLRQKLNAAIADAGQLGGLPSTTVEALSLLAAELDLGAGQAKVAEKVEVALRDLELRRAAAQTRVDYERQVAAWQTEAAEMDSYVFLDACDKSREEYYAIRQGLRDAELTTWCREQLRTLSKAKAQAVLRHRDDSAWRQEKGQQLVAERFYKKVCDAVQQVGYIEVQMETVVPSQGALVPADALDAQRRVFRRAGQLDYGKVVELGGDGQVAWRTVRLAGPGGAVLGTVEADKAECRRQSDENDSTVLDGLLRSLEDEFGDDLPDVTPLIDSRHVPFAGLATETLTRVDWEAVQQQLTRETGHGRGTGGENRPRERSIG